MNNLKGRFIVFEGIDGCGSSTQAQLLHEYFTTKHGKSHLTAEPSTGPFGNMCRQILFNRIHIANGKHPHFTDSNLFDTQMAHLMATDRHDHLYNDVDGILKSINNGSNVICTRYILSSYAYQGNTPEEIELVGNLNSHFPLPDLLIYLDNTVQSSMRRMHNRIVKDVHENVTRLTHTKENYDNVLKSYTGELYTVDATLPIAVIANKIISKINELNF